jgi:hypothetical protein
MNNLDCLLGSLDRFYGMYRQVSGGRRLAVVACVWHDRSNGKQHR